MESPALPLLPRRLSPTAIAQFRVCPRMVWFKLVARATPRERPSPALVLGNAVHDALDKFFGLPVADRSERALHACLRAVWAAHRRPGAFLSVEEERACGQEGLRMLSAFHAAFDTSAVPLAREQWASVRLPGGVELYGKIDRVDGERGNPAAPIELVDYKTGRRAPESADLPGEPAVQAYVLAAEQEYGREVSRVRVISLAAGSEARWEPEREDVDAARAELARAAAGMLAERGFPAQPGEHCRQCAFSHHCPDAGRTDLAGLAIPDDIAF